MPRSVVQSKNTVRVKSTRGQKAAHAPQGGASDLDLMDLSDEQDEREAAWHIVSGQAGATHPRVMSSDDAPY